MNTGILAVTGASLALAPLFRGLYFPLERLLAVAVVGVLALAAVALGGPAVAAAPETLRRRPLPGNWWWAAGLAGAYWASLAVAADKGEALVQALLFTAYAIAFGLAVALARRGMTRPVLWSLAGAGGLAAAVGLLAASGLLRYHGALDQSRVASTVQYPNSLASLVLASLLVCAALASEDRSAPFWRRRLPWTLLGAALFVVLILTYSRGAWLLSPLLAGLGLALAPRSFRGPMAVSLGAAASGAAAGVILASRGLDSLPSPGVWAALGAALAVAAAVLWLVDGVLQRRAWVRPAVLAVLGGLVLWAAVACWQASMPVVLRHSASEPPGARTYPIFLSGVESGGYEMELQVAATGPQEAEEAAYCWRVVVQADQSGTAETQPSVTTRLQGGPLEIWSVQRVSFTQPPGADRVRVLLVNYFPGTEARFRSIRMWPAGSPSQARELLSWYRRLLPAPLVGRLGALSTGEYGLWSRLVFMGDALRAWRDRPLLGGGGGAWAVMFPQYRRYMYSTTEVHSFPLEVAVETGLLGLACLAGLAWGLVRGALRALRGGGREGLLTNAAAAAALALGLHGCMDFNLSLPALSLFLWVAAGLVYGGVAAGGALDAVSQPDAGAHFRTAPTPAKKGRRRSGRGDEGRSARGWLRPAVALGLAGLLALDLCLICGAVAADRGTSLLRAGEPREASRALRSAVQLNPLDSTSRMQLAVALQKAPAGAGDRGGEAEIRHWAESAVALNPLQVKLRTAYSSLALGLGDLGLARAQLERALELSPHGQELYGHLARLYALTGLAWIEKGDPGRAVAEFEAVRSLNARYQAIRESTAQQSLPSRYRMADIPPLLALCLGQIDCLEGRLEQAVDRLELAAAGTEGKLQAEAVCWLGVALRELGRGEEAEAAWALLPGAGSEREATILQAGRLVAAWRAASGGASGE